MDTKKIEKLAKLLTHKEGIALMELIATRKEVPYADLKEVTPNEVTLKRRLDELKELGLIQRVILDKKYKPTIYRVTSKGEEVFKLVQQIGKTFE